MIAATSRAVQIAALAAATLLARPAASEPARRATQADIDRLEAKLAAQRRLLEQLVALHRQQLAALDGLLAGDVAPPPPPPPSPPPPPQPVPDVTPEPAPAVAVVEVRKKGVGTLVGRVTGGATDVFVYVEDIIAPAKGKAVMKQERKQFAPRVMAVQQGTKVEFPNLDAVFHNVFSVTPGREFDLGSYPEGESKGVALTTPGVINVFCNLHPRMIGYVLVVPNRHFARAGSDGFYRLAHIPAGKHRIVAWAPNALPVVRTVNIPVDEVVTLELEVRPGRERPHLNKHGMPYSTYD